MPSLNEVEAESCAGSCSGVVDLGKRMFQREDGEPKRVEFVISHCREDRLGVGHRGSGKLIRRLNLISRVVGHH